MSIMLIAVIALAVLLFAGGGAIVAGIIMILATREDHDTKIMYALLIAGAASVALALLIGLFVLLSTFV